MYRSQYFEGGRVLTAALSAIDIALYDIKGKALGVPVYELLGGSQRDFVPTFAIGPGVRPRAHGGADPDGDGADGRACGWIRREPSPETPTLFEPWESLSRTAEWMVRRARGGSASGVVLGVDYHHRLTVAEAASFCQRMPTRHAGFSGRTDPRRDAGGLRGAAHDDRRFRSRSARSLRPNGSFCRSSSGDLTQYTRLDICNVGGFTEAMKVAGWCEAHYVDLMPHNPLGPVCTAATVQLAAAVPNFSWLETRSAPTETHLGFDSSEFFPVQVKLDGADYPVPDGLASA